MVGPDSSQPVRRPFRVAVMMAATARAVGDREVTVKLYFEKRTFGTGYAGVQQATSNTSVYRTANAEGPREAGRHHVRPYVVTQHHRLLERELEHALAVGWSDTPKELAQPVDE